MTVSEDLKAFVARHRASGCGTLRGGADALVEDTGYRAWLTSACGETWERWVTHQDAIEDLVESSLIVGSNSMRALFTIHAGEFVVGSEIERQIPGADVWIPAKDAGVDLLVTTKKHLARLQV